MKITMKEHLVSAGYTFATVFILSILVSIQDLSWNAIGAGAIGGVVLAAVRAGVKAIIPLFQSLHNAIK